MVDEERVLALHQIRSHGLPDSGRISERAQDVVVQLERLTDRPAVCAEPHELHRRDTRQKRAELDRALDRVSSRLEAERPQKSILAGIRLVRKKHLQVLPPDHLLAHPGEGPVERLAARRPPHGRIELHGPCVGEIAQKHGYRAAEIASIAPIPLLDVLLSEAGVRGRLSATHLAVVHDVIVDEKIRVKQLRAHGQRQHVRVRLAAARPVAVVYEGRAQPLPTAGDQPLHLLDEFQALGLQRHLCPLASEEARELGLQTFPELGKPPHEVEEGGPRRSLDGSGQLHQPATFHSVRPPAVPAGDPVASSSQTASASARPQASILRRMRRRLGRAHGCRSA